MILVADGVVAKTDEVVRELARKRGIPVKANGPATEKKARKLAKAAAQPAQMLQTHLKWPSRQPPARPRAEAWPSAVRNTAGEQL